MAKVKLDYETAAALSAFAIMVFGYRGGLPAWSFPVLAIAFAVPVAMLRDRRVGAPRVSLMPHMLEVVVGTFVFCSFGGVVYLAKQIWRFDGPTTGQISLVASGTFLFMLCSMIETAPRGVSLQKPNRRQNG
jgi:hypothetical protein